MEHSLEERVAQRLELEGAVEGCIERAMHNHLLATRGPSNPVEMEIVAALGCLTAAVLLAVQEFQAAIVAESTPLGRKVEIQIGDDEL